MKKIIILFSFLLVSEFIYAQELLLTDTQIEHHEKKVTKYFKKLQKKQNKKRLKKRFKKYFNESILKNTTELNSLMQPNSEFEPHWEEILNKMYTLQYLYNISKYPFTKELVSAQNYSLKIDSITNVATKNMYRLGKELIEKKETPFAYMAAYNYLTRVENLHPNYLDTRQLIEEIMLKGRKQVYFSPVTYDNNGSFMEFGFGKNKSSMSSDFIIEKLINELQKDNPNSIFVNSPNEADWIVNLKWLSVNMDNRRVREYTEERSSEIKENGKKVTVRATVKFVVTTIDVSGELNYQIKDKNNNIIANRTLSGFSPFSKEEITYTGDRRALTYDDLKMTNDQPVYVDDNYDLLTKMYLNEIHPQLMKDIGPLLNWNYKIENK